MTLEESERALEKTQEVLIETMPEDIPIIDPYVVGSMPVLSTNKNFDVESRQKSNSFKLKQMLPNDELNTVEDSRFTLATS